MEETRRGQRSPFVFQLPISVFTESKTNFREDTFVHGAIRADSKGTRRRMLSFFPCSKKSTLRRVSRRLGLALLATVPLSCGMAAAPVAPLMLNRASDSYALTPEDAALLED